MNFINNIGSSIIINKRVLNDPGRGNYCFNWYCFHKCSKGRFHQVSINHITQRNNSVHSNSLHPCWYTSKLVFGVAGDGTDSRG